ncbi:WD40-repeat-containing domain protein [Pilobolus umbonatus]|nr:WD40-repeat-containing domain protein [Pilobolus umbonatus]
MDNTTYNNTIATDETTIIHIEYPHNSHDTHTESPFIQQDRKRSHKKEEDEHKKRLRTEYTKHTSFQHSIHTIPYLIEEYDHMPDHVKSSLLLDLIHKSTKNTVQWMVSIMNTTLKRDFITSLPRELVLHILSYLDVYTLCHACYVNKQWKEIVDNEDKVWYRLLMKDGYDTGMYRDCTYKESYRKQYILKMNWKKGRFRRTEFDGHSDSIVTCLQFDDDKIISGATDTIINIYHTNDPTRPVDRLEGHAGGVWAMQYVDNTLVSGSTDRSVRVWNIQRRKCTHLFKGHLSTVRCLLIVTPILVNGVMEPSEPLIVTGSRDSTIRVWKLPDVENEAYLEKTFVGEDVNPWFKFSLVGHTNSVRSVAAHGNLLVSGSYDNSVIVWNLETGRMVHRMERHSSNVYSVVIDPIRRQCMSGSMDSVVYIWDLNTGACLHKLEGHDILVGLLGLSTQYLVSAAADKTIRVWDPSTGVCEYVLTGHMGAITCFKHDNDKIVSGSEGGLKLWDINTGKLIVDLIHDVKGVWWVTFDKRRCIVAVLKNDERTSFQMLDFGVHGLIEDGV